jgi:hypothetical protein
MGHVADVTTRANRARVFGVPSGPVRLAPCFVGRQPATDISPQLCIQTLPCDPTLRGSGDILVTYLNRETVSPRSDVRTISILSSGLFGQNDDQTTR